MASPRTLVNAWWRPTLGIGERRWRRHPQYAAPADAITSLGITCDFNDPQNAHLRREPTEKALVRLNRVSYASHYAAKRVGLARCLSLYAWAAGFVNTERERKAIEPAWDRAVLNRRPRTAAEMLVRLAVAGVDAIPEVFEDTSMFSMLYDDARRKIAIPAWMPTAGEEFLVDRFTNKYPQLRGLLRKLHWTLEDNGRMLSMQDGEGKWRRTDLTSEGGVVARTWLHEAFLARDLKDAPRLQEHCQRSDEHEPTGRRGVPRVATGLLPALEAHSRAYKLQEAPRNKAVCLGAAPAVWFQNAGDKDWRRDPEDPRAVCLCGRRLPSTKHLFWNCLSMDHLRFGLRLPPNNAEEGLLAATNEQRPALDAQLPAGVWHILKTCVRRELGERSPLFAFDGGAKDNIASWAVVASCGASAAHLVCGEDASSFHAELTAAIRLTEARAEVAGDPVAEPTERCIVIVFDCEAANQVAVSRRAIRARQREAAVEWSPEDG